MSEFTTPGHATYLAEARRLVDAIGAAQTAEDREHAEHELSLFLRLNALGRLAEWFARPRGED